MDNAATALHTLMPVAGERPISPLILAELYESGDAAFVDRLLEQQGNPKAFLGIIEKWKKDRSPRARQMKARFLRSERHSDMRRVVLKRLFKQAWHDRDHELMGLFMAELDRSLRRKRGKRHRYVRGAVETQEVLRLSPRGKRSVFSTETTHYLRRRAWRYFRRLGFRDAAAYVPAVAQALVHYSDDDVRLGQNLLDNWGLMHACFGKSEVLAFSARHTNIRAGRRLAEMIAAPMFETLWSAPEAAEVLLNVLLDAGSRPVRVWAIQLLKRHHSAALAEIEAGLLLRLIDHADSDVAAFAAELLENASIAGTLPAATWVRLLGTRNPTIVAAVTDAFRRHVSFDRVTLAQAVEIASQQATPVARLGLEILELRDIRSDADRALIAQLAFARCAALADSISGFALGRLNLAGVYQLSQVIPFFDSALLSMRHGAFAALDDASPASGDPAFWSALLESPYDDVSASLVDRLRRRQALPGVSSDSLAMLWQSVLLNIYRGGRAKLIALKQVSRQIATEPGSASLLLPVVAVAIRSVRPPEARHGLAAVVAAVEQLPALADEVMRVLPELQFDPAGASR